MRRRAGCRLGAPATYGASRPAHEETDMKRPIKPATFIVCGLGLGGSIMWARPSIAVQAASAAAASRTIAARRQEAVNRSPTNGSPLRPVLDRYCVPCHNGKLKTAGLMLDAIDEDRGGESPAVWGKGLRKVHTRAMPPAGPPGAGPRAPRAVVSFFGAAPRGAGAAQPRP